MDDETIDIRTSIFIEELKKTIQTENLIETFVEYLQKTQDHLVMRYLFDVYQAKNNLKKYNITNDDKEIIISCHSVFKFSQKLTDNISKNKIDFYEDRTTDIMVSLALYGSVYEVMKSKISDASDLIKLYEKVCMLINSPMEDIERNLILIDIRTSYYLNFYLPMELFGISNTVSEDMFILYYLIAKDNFKELKEFYCRKLNIGCERNIILSIFKSDNSELLISILNMAVKD